MPKTTDPQLQLCSGRLRDCWPFPPELLLPQFPIWTVPFCLQPLIAIIPSLGTVSDSHFWRACRVCEPGVPCQCPIKTFFFSWGSLTQMFLSEMHSLTCTCWSECAWLQCTLQSLYAGVALRHMHAAMHSSYLSIELCATFTSQVGLTVCKHTLRHSEHPLTSFCYHASHSPTRNVLVYVWQTLFIASWPLPILLLEWASEVKNRQQEQRLRVMVLTGCRTPVGQIQVGTGRSGTSTQVTGHRYSMAGPQHSPGTHEVHSSQIRRRFSLMKEDTDLTVKNQRPHTYKKNKTKQNHSHPLGVCVECMSVRLCAKVPLPYSCREM